MCVRLKTKIHHKTQLLFLTKSLAQEGLSCFLEGKTFTLSSTFFCHSAWDSVSRLILSMRLTGRPLLLLVSVAVVLLLLLRRVWLRRSCTPALPSAGVLRVENNETTCISSYTDTVVRTQKVPVQVQKSKHNLSATK